MSEYRGSFKSGRAFGNETHLRCLPLRSLSYISSVGVLGQNFEIGTRDTVSQTGSAPLHNHLFAWSFISSEFLGLVPFLQAADGLQVGH